MSAPVGSFAPNRFGLHDMSGNVWEWTASGWRPTHDGSATDAGYELKTIKGGSWDSTPPRLRLSARTALSRRGRHNLYVGFRCLRPTVVAGVWQLPPVIQQYLTRDSVAVNEIAGDPETTAHRAR
jgi:hypothetical protein